MSSYKWLITGASGGLGANIALAALNAGSRLWRQQGTLPKLKESYREIEKKGGSSLSLDVTSPENQNIVEKAVGQNNVNVVVNDAGYALRGVLEDLRYSSYYYSQTDHQEG